MKIFGSSILVLAAIAAAPAAHASPAPEFCRVLRAFVDSVQAGEKRQFTFRTSWGSNFKDTAEPAIFAKRCAHESYAPAEKVCTYLMEHGSTEFTGVNVKDAVSCLSRKTAFDPRLSLNKMDVSFRYGSDSRGALVDITLNDDSEFGGMAFRLVADGY
jgi:hypothetical protein